ncbi:hypothetical protein [Alteraurantiacibacter buctensis]|uniref:Uncharacterized protein n=1 Tax=Alteraurantiacibacter buctensis TaxID=1503981 RepID=A0A844Z2H8_9SPHN|nr:hypothetical protein [Alteraurantiacibacter buctensis]MXO72894.1 hypothetical protein [Alteraurantiacibacter buctensis]
MTDPAALLPCPNPWCDGDKQEPWRSSGGWWRVGCQCGFDGPSARSPEEAIAAWNERTGQLVPRAAVEGAVLADALLSAADWRPFASAPKDGTVVIVFREDAGIFMAHYVEEDAHLSSPAHPPEGDCFWFSTQGEDLTSDLPTLWMPLDGLLTAALAQGSATDATD